MATIRISNVGGKEYIQVITYEINPRGQNHLKILKSFGPNTPRNMIEAKIFKTNFELLEKLKNDPDINLNDVEKMGAIEKVAGSITGAILGWKLLEYLCKKK
jgi:predicted secreted Zn-dependent protease